GSGLGLAAAALAVVSPDLFFASFVLADPLAYPLVLTTLYAAVCALSRPSRRAQVAFIVLAGLTALTRVQYALLPIVFVVGALAVERGSIRSALRSFQLTWGVFAAPLAALVVLGPSRVLGYYNNVVDLHVQPWFALYLKRDRPARLPVALLAVALLAVSARVPLAPYSVGDNKQDSPFLLGVFRLEHAIGAANGSLAIAIAAAILSALAVGIAWRASLAMLALALSLLVAVAASAGSASVDRHVADSVR